MLAFIGLHFDEMEKKQQQRDGSILISRDCSCGNNCYFENIRKHLKFHDVRFKTSTKIELLASEMKLPMDRIT